MKTVTVGDNSGVWKYRWTYCRVVAELLAAMPEGRVLEIGCREAQIVPDSDRLDIESEHADIQWDIRSVPWPLFDKAYDLAIALEVWEHLHERQLDAFHEIGRVARSAIMSFPYRWQESELSDHIGIDDQVIATWTGFRAPVFRREVVPPDKPGRHLVLMFTF